MKEADGNSAVLPEVLQKVEDCLDRKELSEAKNLLDSLTTQDVESSPSDSQSMYRLYVCTLHVRVRRAHECTGACTTYFRFCT